MQYMFRFNVDRCAECHACEIACKAEHDLRPRAQEQPGATGPNYRKVVTLIEGEKTADSVQYISMACMHCGDAACMAVCPTQAIYRDEEFGAVLVNRDRCVGCRYCGWACEFGAPQYDVDGLMQKCDMCIDRLRAGLQPACVETCCGGAISCGPVQEISTDMRKKQAEKLVHAAKTSANVIL